VGFPVGNQVDFMLSLLRLKAVLGSAVVADTATAQDDDDGPHQPEPPEFIVVVAALRLSTAVSCITDVALIVGTHTGFFILRGFSHD
jgi:TctA family transporter